MDVDWDLCPPNITVKCMPLKYLKKSEEKTKRDRIRNRTRTGLGIIPLQETKDSAHLRWFGHDIRMGYESYHKMAWQARTQGQRSKGRS
jgi:hypothetical protein